MEEDYFSPSASPNLPQDDPLRSWLSAVQSDPQLAGLMTTDPQGAIDRMKELGIPPPPQGFTAYTDGLGAENSIPNRHPKGTPPGTYGGAEPSVPYPPGGDPMTADARPPSILERAKTAVTGMFPTFSPSGQLQGNLTSAQGQPPAAAPPLPVPRPQVAAAASSDDTGANLDGGVPMPRARPPEAGPGASDFSAKKKESLGDALSGFGKSLQGVKPVPPPAPNFVGTPSAPSHPAIQAPNLNALLAMVGQGAPSPLGLTLGRLLATGKA